jgi:peptidoglycan hydrolase-like protein with peptidoglycan-binding domain
MPSIFDNPDSYTGPVTPEPSIFNTDEENVILREGSGGTGRIQDTRRIQQRLKASGYDPGAIDGIWGPKTCAAMLHFQKAKFGAVKMNYLDYDTFVALSFDTMTADRFARTYGFTCGATGVPKKEEERNKDFPPGEGVGQADIKKIQEKLRLRQTGTFNVETCKELFRIQQNNGNMQSVLLSSTFEKLGYTGTEAKRLASGFAGACTAYWEDLLKNLEPKVVPGPKPKPQPDPGPGPKPLPEPGPQKAGFTWLLWAFGGIAVAGIAWTALKKRKA